MYKLKQLEGTGILKEHPIHLPFLVQLPFHCVSREKDGHQIGASPFIATVGAEAKDTGDFNKSQRSLFLHAGTRPSLQIRQT